MRTLLILRHAKAVGPSPDGDFARGLAPRGRRNAKQFGEWLAATSFAPELALVSPARRTMETADGVFAAFPSKPARRTPPGLYNAEATDILAEVRAVSDDIRALIVIGHNPGVAELAIGLTGSGDAAARSAMSGGYPTCACVVLQFDTTAWQSTLPGAGALLAYVTPSQLDGREADD